MITRSSIYLRTLNQESVRALQEPVVITTHSRKNPTGHPVAVLMPYKQYVDLQSALIKAEEIIRLYGTIVQTLAPE